MLCREREGNQNSFTCMYHGWTYDIDGKLVGIPGRDSYSANFDAGEFGLAEVPLVDNYRGFWFVHFDAEAPSLIDYLAGATEYIDLVVDQSPGAQLEILSGSQEYDIRGNWKLLVENSFDDYHLHATHSTYLDYMKDTGVDVKLGKGLMMPTPGIGKALGNGRLKTPISRVVVNSTVQVLRKISLTGSKTIFVIMGILIPFAVP